MQIAFAVGVVSLSVGETKLGQNCIPMLAQYRLIYARWVENDIHCFECQLHVRMCAYTLGKNSTLLGGAVPVGRFPGGVEPAPPPVSLEPAPPPVGLEPGGTVTPAVGFVGVDPVLEGLVGTTPPVVGLSEVGLAG